MSPTWKGAAVIESLFWPRAGGQPLLPPTEWHARGDEFLSTHPPTEAHPFRTELRWSAQTVGEAGVVVTLTVSLQTQLLDTRPVVDLLTPAGGSEAGFGQSAWRLNSPDPAQVVLAPHPSDAVEVSTQSDGDSTLLRLSPPFLEKGVIRRCRVAALFLPASAGPAQQNAAFEAFAESPLPLTA